MQDCGRGEIQNLMQRENVARRGIKSADHLSTEIGVGALGFSSPLDHGSSVAEHLLQSALTSAEEVLCKSSVYIMLRDSLQLSSFIFLRCLVQVFGPVCFHFFLCSGHTISPPNCGALRSILLPDGSCMIWVFTYIERIYDESQWLHQRNDSEHN